LHVCFFFVVRCRGDALVLREARLREYVATTR
jgi:hypothetical protein